MASIHREDRPLKPWKVSWRERGRQRGKRFATEREARDFARSLGRAHDPSKITLREWAGIWLTTHGLAWAPRTVKDRADYLDRLILPYLGHLRLTEITRGDVRAWQRELVRAGKSAYTVNRVVQVLSAALGAAEEDDAIGSNPCRGVRPIPRRPHAREVPEIAAIEAIRAHLASPRDRLMVSLMAYAGLRPSECRTLTWGDIGTNVITVYAGKTRTVRHVPIIAPVRMDIEGARGVAEPPVTDRALVITGPHLDRWNWQKRVWHPARVAAGHPTITPYGLRHAFAHMQIAAGLDAFQVARLMGHSTPQMVLSVYGGLFAERELTADRLDLEPEIARARARAAHDNPRTSRPISP